MRLLLVLSMVAAGICVSIQGPVNARLRLAVDSPVFSAAVSFFSGTLVLACVMAMGALGGSGFGFRSLLPSLLGNARTGFTGFTEGDGDGLFAILDFVSTAGFEIAFLELTHHLGDLFAALGNWFGSHVTLRCAGPRLSPSFRRTAQRTVFAASRAARRRNRRARRRHRADADCHFVPRALHFAGDARAGEDDVG